MQEVLARCVVDARAWFASNYTLGKAGNLKSLYSVQFLKIKSNLINSIVNLLQILL